MPPTDSELLRRFAEDGHEDAFAELVGRRINLVYAAALRQVGGDAHRAQDIAQEVFIDLARKARTLCQHPSLLGWLYTSTHFAAVNIIRVEQRRKRREEEAQAMNDFAGNWTASAAQRGRAAENDGAAFRRRLDWDAILAQAGTVLSPTQLQSLHSMAETVVVICNESAFST